MIQGDRRRDDGRWFELTTEINILKAQHGELKEAVAQNTAITNEIKDNTTEIVEFFKAGKGFFTMMGYFGKAVKWTGAVAGALAAIWAAREIGK
jgi:uncharacterized spore protein YtfJ